MRARWSNDMDGVAELVTALGKQHEAWVRQRGLHTPMDDYEAS